MMYKSCWDGKRLFVVRMLRHGDPELHSYILGVYSGYELALCKAEEHMKARSGKYYGEILDAIVDSDASVERYRFIDPADCGGGS